MPSTKRKLNLTVDEGVVERAKRVVESRGQSLSSCVEEFLARLVLDDSSTGDNWLEAFHRRFLEPDYQEPSDQEIDEIRNKIAEKYS